jgi:CelD/BcsL family acetyltransferase involved in cellulose biosynthesis
MLAVTPIAAAPFTVEVEGEGLLAGEGWPSVADLGEPDGPLGTPYQSREFLRLWVRTVGRARRSEPLLVTLRDRAGHAVVRLAFCLERPLGFRVLRFMDGGVADYNAPILARGLRLDPDRSGGLWHAVRAALPRYDAADLAKIAPEVEGEPNPLAAVADGLHGHRVTLASTFDSYMGEGPRRKIASDARRRRRNLEQRGPVAFVMAGAAEASPLFEALEAQKRAQYLRKSGEDHFELPGVLAFYRALAEPAALGSLGHLSGLRCGGDWAATHLGFVTRRSFHYTLPAYDSDTYGSSAAGRELMIELMRWCFASGRGTFDLGEGDAAYKESWETARFPLLKLEEAASLAGRLYFTLKRAKTNASLRRAYDSLSKRSANLRLA